MSESKYESKITSAPCTAEQIYRVLSNMQNLERVRELIPQDKVQEFETDTDFVRLKVDGLGQKILIPVKLLRMPGRRQTGCAAGCWN